MKKNIAIIGAFDRYNYGDLLFPIIIELYLKNFYKEYLPEYEINYYGLKESDLSIYGGKITKSIKELFVKNNMPNDSILIVSGGNVLPARLSDMHLDLQENRLILFINKVFRKLIGINIYEKLLKKNLNIDNGFPWIYSKKDFSENVSIVYNTVGGASLNKLKAKEQDFIKQKLKSSDYLSVRDKSTKNNLIELSPKLYPDSATIMSEIFSMNILKDKISERVKYIANEFPNGYICIQSNLFSIRNKEHILAEQLELIVEKFKVGVVLLPIGIASNHDDDIALKRLKMKLKISAVLPEKINVYDIMYLISNSKFFGGTSLHGNITAMSYAIPHIGLNKDITKLDEYLKTWDLKEQGYCIAFNELFNKFEEVINIPKERLINKRDQLIELSQENFENMFNKILKE
jgi:hypothetical protein